MDLLDSSGLARRHDERRVAERKRRAAVAIKAQAQVARASSNDEERIRALDNAILGCDRATHLIEQLLTLARIDTLGEETAESCLLRAIAAETIAAIAPAALNQNVRIELTEGDEVAVRGNPVLLRIMLRNLIDNAVRHTPPGSTVTISVSNEQGNTSLSVSDNGPGIPEQELARLTERFYRPLGTQASGSGLGLSIVKRIAEIHNASLQIASRDEGAGLRVEVIFR